MKHFLTCCGLLIGLSTLAAAQTPRPPQVDHRGYGYAVAGGFGNEGVGGFTAAVGGEGLVYQGVSLGGDFTLLAPSLKWRRSFGVAAFNGGYHFVNADGAGKLVPFVTAGPLAFFGDGIGYGFHAGGGVNYWFKERLGARFEVRVHTPVNTDLRPFVSGRAGITFR